MAIEAQDIGHLIEIHTYLTAKIKPDDATNIMINDANAEKDAITGLLAPTNFGRPNWDTVFKSIRAMHKPADVGVCRFPPDLASCSFSWVITYGLIFSSLLWSQAARVGTSRQM